MLIMMKLVEVTQKRSDLKIWAQGNFPTFKFDVIQTQVGSEIFWFRFGNYFYVKYAIVNAQTTNLNLILSFTKKK